MNIETLKKQAAEKAVEQVQSGMVLGLGTGSTTRYAVIKIGELWQAGDLTDIVALPTSVQTAELAQTYGIPLTSLDQQPKLDLAIDGADEVDPQLNLIKGHGGALLREKMVESAAARFIVVVDTSKIVTKLGTRYALPIEVVKFGWKAQIQWLESFGYHPEIRGGEQDPFVTDNGNYIIHCDFPDGIADPAGLADQLINRVGVVEHGLFLNMASEVIVAGENGLSFLKRG
ncbi:MAG: ribose 5-phosphate isomerase A [Anaerolineaceae bacterium]|nr:ribose 5-phosphate isomerase A [Anaerolineaceae bacterium]MCB9098841.1 ribose 5-phosphate isomerase A [Anaerolineales bacterium]